MSKRPPHIDDYENKAEWARALKLWSEKKSDRKP